MESSPLLILGGLLALMFYLIGFGPSGIVGGSYTAQLMATLAPIMESEGFVAMLQLLGPAGGMLGPYSWILAIPSSELNKITSKLK